jgi:type I restriction enzyme S subunit
MELRSGYKQTEVGIIPEDWNLDHIENLALITTGSKNTQDRVEHGRYPFFVRSQNIERINSYSFDGEAVLTAGDGVGTGKVFHYINGRFDVHQRVYRISNFIERIDGYFFYLYFSAHFYNRIMQMTAKSSVDSVRRDMIARMLVPLPPTEGEQRAIATALRDVDALLVGLDRLIAKKRDLKQAAMQRLLTGQARLPGDWVMKSGFKQSEVGLIPEDWDVLPFKEQFDISAGGDVDTKLSSSVQDEKHCYPIYSNALSDRGLYGYCSYADHPANSITITARGTLGFATYRDHKYTAVGRVLVLHPKRNSAGAFLAEFINSRVKFAIESTGVPQLTAPQIGEYRLAIPPSDEQAAIAAVLSDMDAELSALVARRDKTRDLKKAMMQELLTGKTRLVPTGGSHA